MLTPVINRNVPLENICKRIGNGTLGHSLVYWIGTCERDSFISQFIIGNLLPGNISAVFTLFQTKDRNRIFLKKLIELISKNT